jgi:hypothetical protein
VGVRIDTTGQNELAASIYPVRLGMLEVFPNLGYFLALDQDISLEAFTGCN